MASTMAPVPASMSLVSFSASRLASSFWQTCLRTPSSRAWRVRAVAWSPIRMRIVSSFCHLPSSARSDPISKKPVAMSNELAISVQSCKYFSPFQLSSLLSTMNSSPPDLVGSLIYSGPNSRLPASDAVPAAVGQRVCAIGRGGPSQTARQGDLAPHAEEFWYVGHDETLRDDVTRAAKMHEKSATGNLSLLLPPCP